MVNFGVLINFGPSPSSDFALAGADFVGVRSWKGHVCWNCGGIKLGDGTFRTKMYSIMKGRQRSIWDKAIGFFYPSSD